MTFNQDLKSAFDALTERLQAEVARQVQEAIGELPPPAAAPAVEPSAPATATDHAEQLLASVRNIDEAKSLTDILDALTGALAASATRAAVLLRRRGEWHAWRAIGFSGDVNARELADRSAMPLVISGETIGAVYADGGSPASIELLARHASRCLESMTAFKTARALARQDDRRRDESTGDDEDASAQRYAKLLVSEIKLYHESDVVAGRRERDLGSRLGGEIARARVLYDQRVPPHVRQRGDFFRDELVRTLADGDAGLLEIQA